MSDQPAPAPNTPRRTKPDLTTPSQVSVHLEGAMVVIPLEVYDALLTAKLAIAKGDYVLQSEVEQRVKQSVDRAMRAMAITLEREVSNATQQNRPASDPAPIPG